ncbi:MAG: hypothetical protein AMJ61_15545 [Desulfobacterales bacterium SG8_35_2]|nr:MAG: hypothetical protein AMJ61_15545 [Desulfobacterales bacterium SG8_35_2]
MKRIVLLQVAFVVMSCALFTPNKSSAEFYSVKDLKVGIRAYEKAERGETYSMAEWEHLAGYVTGVIDSTAHLYNLPGELKVKQAVAILIKYVNDHPEEWNSSASGVLQKALSEAFPKPQ